MESFIFCAVAQNMPVRVSRISSILFLAYFAEWLNTWSDKIVESCTFMIDDIRYGQTKVSSGFHDSEKKHLIIKEKS